MEDSPIYVKPAPYYGPSAELPAEALAPALLSAPQLDALAHALDEERQGCAAEPASPLGYWPSAVAGLLGHVAQMAEALDDEKAYGSQGIDHEFELMRKLDKAEARAAEAEAQVAMLRVELAKEVERTEYFKMQHGYLVGRVENLEKRFHTPAEEAHIADMQEVLSEYWDETRPAYEPGPRQDLGMKRHNDYFNHKAIQYTGKPLQQPVAANA